MRASHSHKGPYDFDHLQQVQDLSGEHSGPVWCMKFSNCGRLLATAGQDRYIRIWVLKDHLPYFQDMRTKHSIEKVSPTPSQESIVSQHSHHSAEEMTQARYLFSFKPVEITQLPQITESCSVCFFRLARTAILEHRLFLDRYVSIQVIRQICWTLPGQRVFSYCLPQWIAL